MKRTLLLLAAITVFHTTSWSQMGWRFGPEIGVGLSTINVAKTTATSQTATAVAGKTSAQIGLMVHKEFSEHFALQPALMYCGKGAKGASINYFEIPVNLVYIKGEGHGFFVSAGPYLGYAMGGKGVSIGKQADSTSLDWSVKSTDFGVQAGMGWQLHNGLIFKFNFDMGLSDLNMESGGQKMTTGTFMFSIGWLLWGESMYDF